MPANAKPEPSPLTREIAAIIKGSLVRYGKEQQELARRIGVSDAQMSRMLNGYKHWDIEQLDGACNFLGISMTDVFRQAEEGVRRRNVVPAPDTEDLHSADLRNDYDLAASEDDTAIDPARGEA